MDNIVQLKCLNTNQTHELPMGMSLMEIAKELGIALKFPVIGALVNNLMTEMSYKVYNSKTIQFVDLSHADGRRMYMRSLSFLLYKAVDDLFPGATVRIEHSVSNGVYCEVHYAKKELDIEDIFAIGEHMRELIKMDIPFKRREMETEKVIELFESRGLTDKSKLMRSLGQLYTRFYQLGEHVDTFFGNMVPSTGYLKTFDLQKYYHGMLLQVPKRNNPTEVEDLIIQNKMFEIFREFSQWNRVLNVTNVGDLNDLAHNGRSENLIKISEALHEKKIAQIADRIAEKKEDVKVVLISGPSSSGKTTFSKRLAIQLQVAGLKPITLSLDNYFVDRDKTPLDENGEYDFEVLEALDVEFFNQQLTAMLNGEEVEIPKFSFETGTRFFDGEKIKMSPENILVIEGIHGLNPQLTHAIPNEAKFKVYVSALTSINVDSHNRIPSTDNRLIRRIVRDYRYRGYSAQNTISRWNSVRKGEDLHIFPFQEEADVMFNSALLYELAVLKQFAEPILLEVLPNQSEYPEAQRLLKFFGYFKPIKDRGIPPTSIIREFFGGSSFSY